ncbi:MAG TPA: hypothetical protein PLO61_05730 [Fimbriimonadaceae bacterium]|nr:hypothetical protein [Fimbriimonadaceae bacterium]HRJ33382.1 hypothetical protein [Fimbriimonadaceae bacterium]
MLSSTATSNVFHRTQGSPVRKIAFHEELAIWVTADSERILRAWDHRGELIWENDFRALCSRDRAVEIVRDLVFDSAGEALYATCGSTLHRLDARSGRVEWEWEGAQVVGFRNSMPQHLAALPDGSVITSTDTGVFVRFGRQGEILQQREFNEVPKNFVFWPERGEIVGSDGYSLSRWDAATLQLKELQRLGEPVYGFAFDPHRAQVALRFLDRVHWWTLGQPDRAQTWTCRPGLPLVQWAQSGEVLAVTHEHGLDWVSRAGACIESTDLPERVVSLGAFSQGHRVAVGTSEGKIVTPTVPKA